MDEPTLKQLRYAVAVADHEHFGRAADAEFVSQPGLSDQVRELERRLGVTLFERGRQGARVTAAGSDVITVARRILADVADLQQLAAAHDGTIRGVVRLAAIPTMAPYLLPATVGLLHDRWPDARLELVERQSEDLLADLRESRIDLGLLAIPYDTGNLTVEPVLEEAFHLAMPDGHPLAAESGPISVGVLSELEVLLLEDGHCLREHAMQACSLAGQVAHRDVRDASLATLTQMVAAGSGVTLLPETALAVEARWGTGITTRPFNAPAPGRTIALVWRSGDPRHELFSRARVRLTASLTRLTAKR